MVGTAGHLRAAAGAAGTLEREVAVLHREHAGSLSRYAAMLGAEAGAAQDAMQEAFLRYFLARAGGTRIEDPKAWLRRVLRNRLIDGARSAACRAEVAAEWLPNAQDPTVDPESSFSRSELLGRARETLAPRELQCVRLRIEGLRYRQIGELLEIRTGTVGALLARAYKKIRGMGTV